MEPVSGAMQKRMRSSGCRFSYYTIVLGRKPIQGDDELGAQIRATPRMENMYWQKSARVGLARPPVTGEKVRKQSKMCSAPNAELRTVST